MIWDEVRRTRNRLLPVAAVALAGFAGVAWFVIHFRNIDPFGLLCCASPLLAFLGVSFLVVLFMVLNPYAHQLVTLLTSYGPPREVADRIDAELRDPERAVVFGGPRPLYRFNYYGWDLGGPVPFVGTKDSRKLFFFLANESLYQRASINLLGTVPSASARARAVPSIQPLLAGYPNGVPTSNADLDLAQITASSSINEYFGRRRSRDLR